MPAVTAPLAAFDDLLDLERSRELHSGGLSFGLETVRALAQALGPLPEARACVHVAGSEGKTTVVERCAAGLGALGLSVGSFTSPHLVDPLERLRIDLSLPPVDDVRGAVDEVLAACRRADLTPSWFEALWATARVLFARRGLDACVWETGLGGRLDATRCSPAHVCVVSSISLEHSAVLGSTLAAVAREKAGILRPGVPLVLAADVPAEAREVLLARARELSCELRELPASDAGSGGGSGADRPGESLARAALDCLAQQGRIDALTDEARGAVAAWRVAGRGQLHRGVLLDGAHSVAAVEALARRLAAQGAPGPVVLGVTHGRDGGAMARALLPVAAPLILTRAPGPRGLSPQELRAGLPDVIDPGTPPVVLESDPDAALARARGALQAGRRIVVTGSLYLVGHMLSECREDS